jgi:hypothetical protein
MCDGVIAGDVYNQATEARIRLRELSEGFKAANCPDAANFLGGISKLILEMEMEITCLKARVKLSNKIEKIICDLERSG